MRISTLTIAALLSASALAGQQGDKPRPEGWVTRYDRADANDADLLFVDMAPGWHVTTGPAGILYHRDSTASGNFRLESTIHLFPTNGRDREAFGIFFGGRNLDGPDQEYTYFLLRNTGEFLIKHRGGSETQTIHPWTATAAMVRWTPDLEDTATNVLKVEAGPEHVDFYVNDETVASLPRSEVSANGIVGFRINHALNLHLRNLLISPMR